MLIYGGVQGFPYFLSYFYGNMSFSFFFNFPRTIILEFGFIYHVWGWYTNLTIYIGLYFPAWDLLLTYFKIPCFGNNGELGHQVTNKPVFKIILSKNLIWSTVLYGKTGIWIWEWALNYEISHSDPFTMPGNAPMVGGAKEKYHIRNLRCRLPL